MAQTAPFIAQTVLVTGGARSGKSERAERLVMETGLRPVYVATAEAHDGEMERRIGDHQARRGTVWRTVEERFDLAGLIAREATPTSALLVDCLTLWLANLTFGERDISVETEKLCNAIATSNGPVVLVTNEVGLGIVPDTKLGRSFRDDQGRLNQAVAEAVDAVELVIAGQPLRLKPPLVPPVRLRAPSS